MKKSYTALLFGATGAIGQDLVNHLLNSQKWGKIIVIVRRQLQEWKNHPKRNKLQIQCLKDMDQLLQPSNPNFKYENVDSVFVLFGSQVKHGQETFVKVDKTYPLMAGQIALRNKIPHFLLVTAVGSNANSCLLYARTKGQVQNEIIQKKLPLLTIFRPGLLANRHNARLGQKIFGCLCPCSCFRIQAVDFAQVLMLTAQKSYQQSKNAKGVVHLYQHSQILDILQDSRNNKGNQSSSLIKH